MATNQPDHTITAFYESRDYADSAANKLRALGVPTSDVTVSPENARDEYGLYGSETTAAGAPKRTGFRYHGATATSAPALPPPPMRGDPVVSR